MQIDVQSDVTPQELQVVTITQRILEKLRNGDKITCLPSPSMVPSTVCGMHSQIAFHHLVLSVKLMLVPLAAGHIILAIHPGPVVCGRLMHMKWDIIGVHRTQ